MFWLATLTVLLGAQIQVPTGQLVPTDGYLELSARPLDFVASTDGLVIVKTNGGVVVVKDGKVVQSLSLEAGSSMKGIALSTTGDRLFVTDAGSNIRVAKVGDTLEWLPSLPLLAPTVKGSAYPCGFAQLADGYLVVAASRGNEVQIVDPSGQKATQRIPVDIAPYDVKLTADDRVALVTCWSVPTRPKDRTAPSSDSPVPTTKNGIATNGSLVFVDLARAKVTHRLKLGRQPTDIAVARDGRVYVAEANNDTVAVVDVAKRRLQRRITFGERLHGVAPNGLRLSPTQDRLYVSLAGRNELAVVDLTGGRERSIARIPTQWYPGPIQELDGKLLVGCLKGVGKGPKPADAKGHNVYQFSGTMQWLPLPLSNQQASLAPNAQRPTPNSTLPPFEHVVYILKENRTYDQVLGDMGKGDGDSSLTIYGKDVTPNHHALADEFVLLDNYYCNGVNSADGHAWSVEGNATPYFERSFGGWTRSYPFGDDPLSVSSSGFVWDALLDAGMTFRNYGEFDYADTDPKTKTWTDLFKDRTIKLTHNIGVEKLRRYSHPEYPGWNMKIPDQLRADIFLKEFANLKTLPQFSFVYLPEDHTSGLEEGMPTPRAMVADNDLAVGRIVDAISRSKYWPKTCIFVIEDDPQDGFDHVDGHRSLCLVISPYTLRRSVVSQFYNQTSVLRTMSAILNVKPRTIHVAESPLMSACFQATPVLTPYTCRRNIIPLDEMNPSKTTWKGTMREIAALSGKMDFTGPDRVNDESMNRILWHAAKGAKVSYPEDFEGAHGKGLAKRGLAGSVSRRP